MSYKTIVMFVTCGILAVNTSVYLREILRRNVRPHVFSWIVWGICQGIGGAAQVAKGAGVGAGPTLFGAVTCAIVTLLACLYHGERQITRSDWIAFLCALAALPLWAMTDDPLWASAMVSLIDAVGGMYPTFRKAWHKPFEENLFLFATATLNCALSLVALESYSLTTMLYPGSMLATHGVFSLTLIVRRKMAKNRL